MTSNPLLDLRTLEDLDQLFADASGPVLLFKHSPTCGTSAMAHEEVSDLLAGAPIGARVGLVLVQAARPVSNAVAERFGVRHESPQVLLIQGDRVVWQASHFGVTADAIREAIGRLGVPSAH